MMEMVLDPDAFRAWLLAHDEGAVVGKGVSACQCPLALYLRERDGGVYSVVGDYCTARFGEMMDEVFRLPGWAEEFVLQVDMAHEDGAPVLREEALAVLEQVLVGVSDGIYID
jgi:hypothetical protein